MNREEAQDAQFRQAQKQYDAKEPPEVTPCEFCGEEGKVVVIAIRGVDGIEAPWPKFEEPEIDCPFCT